jgi:hypothetical protein
MLYSFFSIHALAQLLFTKTAYELLTALILVRVTYPKGDHNILAKSFVLKAPTTLRTVLRSFENVTSVSKQAEVPKSSFSQKKK